jgi:adenosylcobinamide-GDP ribazoletransferase
MSHALLCAATMPLQRHARLMIVKAAPQQSEIMRFSDWIRQRAAELTICAIFLTRMPLPAPAVIAKGDVSRALWAAPVVGGVVGAFGATVYGLMHILHVPDFLAATLAAAATVVATGALHEDGLADVADGFGGGATCERKLAIMRDSRIGTYGVCALVLSFMLRVGALASLGAPAAVALALIAAHAAARAPMPAFMRLVPPARTDGLSAGAGEPPRASAIAAWLLGIAVLIACLGPSIGLIAALLLACGFAVMAWLCRRQIGGQTGDVLGALEQLGEVVVLLVAAAAAQGLH